MRRILEGWSRDFSTPSSVVNSGVENAHREFLN